MWRGSLKAEGGRLPHFLLKFWNVITWMLYSNMGPLEIRVGGTAHLGNVFIRILGLKQRNQFWLNNQKGHLLAGYQSSHRMGRRDMGLEGLR